VTVRRILAGVASAALLTLVWASPAHAETSSTISDIAVSDGEIQFVLALNEVPAGASIEAEEATASLDGQALGLSVDSLSDSGDITQTTLLVMDTSDSMLQDGKLDGAKEAAEQFV
jgi:tight adherence protein B